MNLNALSHNDRFIEWFGLEKFKIGNIKTNKINFSWLLKGE